MGMRWVGSLEAEVRQTCSHVWVLEARLLCALSCGYPLVLRKDKNARERIAQFVSQKLESWLLLIKMTVLCFSKNIDNPFPRLVTQVGALNLRIRKHELKVPKN